MDNSSVQCVVSLVLAGTSGTKRWHCRLKITKPVRNSSTILQCANGFLFGKKEPDTWWLKDTPSQLFQGVLKELARAYKNLLDKRADFPTFKKKTGSKKPSSCVSLVATQTMPMWSARSIF
jgi:hypothetical protein